MRLHISHLLGHLLLALHKLPHPLVAIRARRPVQIFDVLLYGALLTRQPARAFEDIIDLAAQSGRAVLVQKPPGLSQTLQRRQTPRDALFVRTGRRAAHRFGSAPQLASGLGQLGERLLAGQAFQPARELLSLLRQLPLIPRAPAGNTLRAIAAGTQTLVLLLLAPR